MTIPPTILATAQRPETVSKRSTPDLPETMLLVHSFGLKRQAVIHLTQQ